MRGKEGTTAYKFSRAAFVYFWLRVQAVTLGKKNSILRGYWLTAAQNVQL